MNIYVASFQKKDICDYSVDIGNIPSGHTLETYLDEWAVDKVKELKAGDILKVFDSSNSNYFAPDKLPAYLIAMRDWTPPESQDPAEISEVTGVPYNIENSHYVVDVIGPRGYPTTANLWETCSPRNKYANKMPWTFNVEGVISDYIAFQWRDAYNDVGNFSLTVPANEENMRIFQPNRYVLIEDSEKIMIIYSIKFNANLLSDGYVMQIYCESLESILNRRVAFPGISLNTIEARGDDGTMNMLYKLVDAYFITPGTVAEESSDGTQYYYYPEREVEFLELPSNYASYFKRPFNSRINKTALKDDILKVVSEICQNNNLGFKIVATPRFGDSRCITWKFILYNGQDRSYNRTNKDDPLLVLSPTMNNVNSVCTTKDSTNFKNVIFCGVEKDSEGFINLCPTQSQTSLLESFIELPAAITSLKDKISTALQDNPVTYTGIYILAVAASRNDNSYTPTVKTIFVDYNGDNHWVEAPKENGNYIYPTEPLSKSDAGKYKIEYYKTYGRDESMTSTSKTGTFIVSCIESFDPDVTGFKDSTQDGWLTPTILREATSAANALSDSGWSSLSGLKGKITKAGVLMWFKTFDAYTDNSTLTKWLCQCYDRSNGQNGIDRREVFVEQESDDDNDWDASAIAAFRANTTILQVNNYDDEDSDEEINERLMTSARKQSGQYNEEKNIDVDIVYDMYEYRSDYDLGDILQVDDDMGNLDSYMVSGVTITDDTTSGYKVIPDLVRYEIIPKGYVRLDYIRVANMLLPVIFSPIENKENSSDNLNYQTAQPDIGPDLTYGYNGYIDEIFLERRSRVTELEFDAKYDIRIPSSGAEPNPLKKNFAMISAIGYDVYGDIIGQTGKKHIATLMPFALISSTIKHPLTLGLGGIASTFLSNNNYYSNERYIYQFLNDFYYCGNNGHDQNYYFYYPGIGIKWNLNASYIDADTRYGGLYKYKEALYYMTDDSKEHVYCLNKAVNETSELISDRYSDYRELRYSVSYRDSDENRLSKRPQFLFAYPYDINNHYYVETSAWDYGHPSGTGDYRTAPGNTITNNPWNRLIHGYDGTVNENYTAITDVVAYNENTDIKYVALVRNAMIGYTHNYELFTGTYGQVNADISELTNSTSYKNMTEFNLYNNALYRYLVLGGYAYYKKGYKEVEGEFVDDIGIRWHLDSEGSDPTSYCDSNNGVVIYRLKVYEYDSAFKVYRWSEYQLNNDMAMVDTPLLGYDSNRSSTLGFQNVESGVENVNIDTRRLVHDYVPVKYIDVGDTKPDDVDIYGLYDIVEQTFIPVNFSPDAELFGGITNKNAVFLESGGEAARL